MRVAQKVLQPFLYFIRNQREMSAVFSVANNKCTFVTGVPWENTFLHMWKGVVKMAWYGDVHFKQWAVTEVPVAEKESVSNNHQQLRNV